MKKILVLLFALLFVTPAALAAYSFYADDAVVDDDVTGFVITAWDDQPFDDTTADMLIVQNIGDDAEFPLPDPVTNEAMQEYADNAWHWAEANRGYGDFCIAKSASEDFLRFAYDGTTEDPDTADEYFYDYTSHRYSGATEGQVKRIYMNEDDHLTAYIMYYCEAAGVHRALRIEWIPDGEGSQTGSWHISNFYRDNVRNWAEMEVCARFSYYDSVGGVKVTTGKSNLNVRACPDGDVIASLKKGSTVSVYRCEETADSGIPYTLISKWTEPDADGYSTLEYFGWVATKYITESPDWVWVYGD